MFCNQLHTTFTWLNEHTPFAHLSQVSTGTIAVPTKISIHNLQFYIDKHFYVNIFIQLIRSDHQKSDSITWVRKNCILIGESCEFIFVFLRKVKAFIYLQQIMMVLYIVVIQCGAASDLSWRHRVRINYIKVRSNSPSRRTANHDL